MKKLIASCLLVITLAGCGSTSQSGGNGIDSACSQFGGTKQKQCEKGMSDVKSALDQYENGG